jgi:hypothetical protein
MILVPMPRRLDNLVDAWNFYLHFRSLNARVESVPGRRFPFFTGTLAFPENMNAL